MTSSKAVNEDRSSTGPRIFFLGAGFSVGARLPLAGELLSLVIEEIRGRFGLDTKFDKSLRRYRRYVAETTGQSHDAIDIEQFCAFLDHEHILGLRGSDTWSSEGNEDQLMLRWGIGSVLHRATPPPENLPIQYLTFARQLRPQDCIVTFNYDLVVERALDAVGMSYRRFPSRYTTCGDFYSEVDSDRDAEDVLVLKVHGSIDWVDRRVFDESVRVLALSDSDESFRRRNLVFGEAPITGIHALVEGPRPEGDPLESVFVIEDLDSYYDAANAWYHASPIILAPSSVKLLYGEPIREFWHGMPRFAWVWSGLGIVGYSLPLADPYALQVLWAIGSQYSSTFGDQDWSLAPKHRIKVVDYRTTPSAANALHATYRFLDPAITDYLLEGFDERAAIELFR